MTFPHDTRGLLRLIARETARMSYPASMSRGKSPVLRKGTKKVLEKYFSARFPILQIHGSAWEVAKNYEAWHSDQVKKVAHAMRKQTCGTYRADAVAAKVLNTFMHQLMKYEWARPLWPNLHLPIDSRVLKNLEKMGSTSMHKVSKLLTSSAYRLTPSEHRKIQSSLRSLIDELNARPKVEFSLNSRVELNLLWL